MSYLLVSVYYHHGYSRVMSDLEHHMHETMVEEEQGVDLECRQGMRSEHQLDTDCCHYATTPPHQSWSTWPGTRRTQYHQARAT